jgi:hypothetical protein
VLGGCVNWEIIGAVGELISGLAVLLTLVYLSWQLRDARNEMRQTIRQNRDTALREILIAEMNHNEDLVRIDSALGVNTHVARILTEKLDLPPKDVQLYSKRQELWWFYRTSTLANLDSLSDHQQYETKQHLKMVYGPGGTGEAWWEAWKEIRGEEDENVNIVESILREAT